MRSPHGLVSAAAIWLCANTAAAQVSGAIIAESARDLSRPHDVVLSPDGAFLYVADVGTDAIKVLDPSTLVTLGAFGEDRLSGPHDVAFDLRGRLLVADTHNHRIAIYEVDGAAGVFVDDIRGSLRTPEGVDVAADGTIYVTSASRHNVVKIRDGAIVADVGESGGDANQYSRPHDVEAASDGRVVVADPGNDRVLETVRFMLGERAILSVFSAHVTWPGNKEMPLHIDQWFMPHPVDPNENYPRPSDVSRTEQKCGDPVTARHPINPPVVCNVMFAITDFTVENGATRLVPGSHRSGVHPAPNTDYDVFHAEVPAGSFVVWEGRTWHAASLNTGNSPRVGITTYWAAPFIRQLLNFPYGLRPEVADALSEHKRALMGFRTWETYGTSDEFGAEWGPPRQGQHGRAAVVAISLLRRAARRPHDGDGVPVIASRTGSGA